MIVSKCKIFSPPPPPLVASQELPLGADGNNYSMCNNIIIHI